jgi:hypothetical protein
MKNNDGGKKMKRCMVLFLIASLVGCYKQGPMKTEQAEVLQLVYVPSTSGVGVGMSMKGNMVMTTVRTSEVWAVVVRCSDHNKTFSIRGKDIFDRCRVGDVVTIQYHEILDRNGLVYDYKTVGVLNSFPEGK